MPNKYKDLSEKSPKEAADIVGKVEKRNYIAHTIREIELAILQTQELHYHIITRTSPTSRMSKIHIADKCCEIILGSDCEETDERKIRLTLAHELGHLIYRIDKLKNLKDHGIIVPSDDEEIYAWQFAYWLIDRKSLEYQDERQRSKFIYGPGELKQSLTNILEKQKPAIRDAVTKALSLG